MNQFPSLARYLVALAATLVIAAPLGLVSAGCGLAQQAPEISADLARPALNLVRGSNDERVWNDAGVWVRVADSPKTYLPAGYDPQAPRTDAAGDWVIDEKDGKRFFIPKRGANGYSRDILFAEAWSITHKGD